MKVFTSYLLKCLHVSAHAFVVLFRLRHSEVNSRGCIIFDTAPLSLEFSIADYILSPRKKNLLFRLYFQGYFLIDFMYLFPIRI